MLLNAGASAININILQGDQSVFTRDISMGGNAYTEAVQKELDLPFESAEQLKKGIPVDGATFEEAQPVLRAVTENVLLEIQKTFDFFKATASSDHIDRIMLSGGASRVDGFREMLAGALQRAGRGVRSVPRGRVGRQEAWWRRRLSMRRRRRSPSVSRCERWATDDSHQPPRRRAPEGAARRPTFDVGQQLTVACSLILVAAVARHRLVVLVARAASRRSVDARDRRGAAGSRAAAVAARRSHSSSKRSAAQLQQRVQLIEQLRSGQSVPVQLLDHVSRSLPDMLWLTDDEAGGRRP